MLGYQTCGRKGTVIHGTCKIRNGVQCTTFAGGVYGSRYAHGANITFYKRRICGKCEVAFKFENGRCHINTFLGSRLKFKAAVLVVVAVAVSSTRPSMQRIGCGFGLFVYAQGADHRPAFSSGSVDLAFCDPFSHEGRQREGLTNDGGNFLRDKRTITGDINGTAFVAEMHIALSLALAHGTDRLDLKDRF